jgi:hypothetical protein
LFEIALKDARQPRTVCTSGGQLSDSRKPDDVQHLLEQRAGSSPPANVQELVFGPSTGQLVVTNRPSPDAVLATRTTDDGYFRH